MPYGWFARCHAGPPPVESRGIAVSSSLPAASCLLSTGGLSSLDRLEPRRNSSAEDQGCLVELERVGEAQERGPSTSTLPGVLGPQILDPPPVVLQQLAAEGVDAGLCGVGMVPALVLTDHSLRAPHEITFREPTTLEVRQRRVDLWLGE